MVKLFFKKGQGALEYMLIIGAVIIVAAIAIMVLTSSSNVALDNQQDPDTFFDRFQDNLGSSKPIYLRISFVQGNNELRLSQYDEYGDIPQSIGLDDLFNGAPVGTIVTVDGVDYNKEGPTSVTTSEFSEKRISFAPSDWNGSVSGVLIYKNQTYNVYAPINFTLTIPRESWISEPYVGNEEEGEDGTGNDDGAGNNPNGDVTITNIIFSDGNGSVDFPHVISSCNDFNRIAYLPETFDDYFVLKNDIDCSSFELKPIAGHKIGTSGTFVPFEGSFDGKGFTINNPKVLIKLNDYPPVDGEFNIGLFGALTGVVANVEINDLNVSHTYKTFNFTQNVGGLAGYLYNGGKIENVSINRAYVKGNNVVGGVVGQLGNSGKMDNIQIYNSYIQGDNNFQVAQIIGEIWFNGSKDLVTNVNNNQNSYNNVLGPTKIGVINQTNLYCEGQLCYDSFD